MTKNEKYYMKVMQEAQELIERAQNMLLDKENTIVNLLEELKDAEDYILQLEAAIGADSKQEVNH